MKTKGILLVFIIHSAIFLVNTSGKEKPTSEKKPLKWESKNWITEAKQPNSKDVLRKERVRRHLFKKGQQQQQQPVVIFNNGYFDEDENSGWAPPPPPPTPGWTRPTTTTTTTTTTTPRPTPGWTTTRGWNQPTQPPPQQNGWGDGGRRPGISGGHSWSIGHGSNGQGGIFGFPQRVVQGGLDIFKRPEPESSEEEYERKTFGISIFKGKNKY